MHRHHETITSIDYRKETKLKDRGGTERSPLLYPTDIHHQKEQLEYYLLRLLNPLTQLPQGHCYQKMRIVTHQIPYLLHQRINT